ncbi:outer membrane protein [Bradyrhizobium neotropicale]|uniref:outer membrane protein n=1 Tax=Bradyrhizobium neotropicale TaxID=1497615 RepID=UPI001AD6658D|nr:outer membrane beta-barrel protein [Bradyrhizobium neotropicale]MBO4222576.1 outer membrane beta-barrel protein [Bradyrhizobium neotropicale]
MKKVLLVTASLVALGAAAPAVAADLAARPYTKAPPVVAAIYDWSGFYIGVNGGWGSSHNTWTNVSDFGFPVGEGSHDSTGGTVGGQVGYRWQTGNWVFGVEAQGNWADFSGSNASNALLVTNRTKIDAFGLFTGQVGYAWNNVLLYVKGGGAVVNSKHEGLFLGVVGDSVEKTRWGGSIGAGLEFAFAPGWSAGVEYNHLFLDTERNTFVNPGFGVTRIDDIKQDADLVTVRLNYKFGFGGTPLLAKY